MGTSKLARHIVRQARWNGRLNKGMRGRRGRVVGSFMFMCLLLSSHLFGSTSKESYTSVFCVPLFKRGVVQRLIAPERGLWGPCLSFCVGRS